MQRKKNWASHQKKWYGKWHVWLGLIAGTIIFIVSLTGTALVYRDEIDQALNPEIFEVLEKKDKLSFQQVVDMAKIDHPDWELDFIFKVEGGPNLPYYALLEDHETEVYFNPYTGKVTGTRVHDSNLMGIVLEIHRTLLIPQVGRYIVGASAMILVILIISGLRLWIPKQWKHLRARLMVKWNAGFARQTYDIHQVLGFYFSPFILLIALTGVVITFLSYIAPIMFLLSFEPPKSLEQILSSRSEYVAGKQPISIDSAIAASLKVLPPETEIEGIGMPHDSVSTYTVYATGPHITATGDNNFLYIDQYSGKVHFNSKADLPNTGKMYLNWVTPVHYGTFGGEVTRVLAFIASLIPGVLFITGIMIWLPRWRGKKKKGNEKGSSGMDRKKEFENA